MILFDDYGCNTHTKNSSLAAACGNCIRENGASISDATPMGHDERLKKEICHPPFCRSVKQISLVQNGYEYCKDQGRGRARIK